MNGLKQRIIGALVLISLAVIFLPMMFDKPHQQRESQIIALPIKPEVPVVSFQEPKVPTYRMLDEQGVRLADVQEPSEPVAKSKPNKVKSDVKNHAKQIASRLNTSVKIVRKTKVAEMASPEVANLAIFKNSYMVQLGTFVNKKNALDLRKKILAMKLDGHVALFKKGNKTMWRVFSGPYVSRKKASSVKKRVDKAYKVKSIIRHF